MSVGKRPLRVVLFGDGESPHLLKWARALAPRVELYVASSRGLAPALAALVAPERTLRLGHDTKFGGGNVALLKTLPRLARWLRGVDADWINAHYLTSHGTLAWLARKGGVRGRLAASAWGSDILVAPRSSRLLRWVTARVLRDAAVCTSDSAHMAQRMRELGAREVMTFPFGLDALPAPPSAKEPRLFFANRGLEDIYDPRRVLTLFAGVASSWPEARLVVANSGSLADALPAPPSAKEPRLFFANRGLEDIYDPRRVLTLFAGVASSWPEARLVVANSGSLADALRQQAAALGLAERIEFVGRLDATAQSALYARARWYLSVPRSDSVSVSVLEAMAHGCIPLLSDLPANRELVRDGANGLILPAGQAALSAAALERLAADAASIAVANRDWVGANALFGPSVDAFVARLERITSSSKP